MCQVKPGLNILGCAAGNEKGKSYKVGEEKTEPGNPSVLITHT